MIQVNRIYLIFNRLVTKKFLVDTSEGDSSMTAGRKLQACVRNCAKGLPWKWMVERNNSLLTPSQ